MPLDSALFNQIVDVLMPSLPDPQARQALVYRVFGDALIHRIDWQGRL